MRVLVQSISTFKIRLTYAPVPNSPILVFSNKKEKVVCNLESMP